MDTLVSIFTNDIVLTAIGLILSAVGVPAFVTKLIVTAAPVAVNLVEQKMWERPVGMPDAEWDRVRKEAAMKNVRSIIPAVVNLIPGTTARIDKAVEAAVYSETD